MSEHSRGIGRVTMSASQQLPYSQACENNKAPILEQLTRHLAPIPAGKLLEIGSGTGQHAVHFARALPHITWQTSDCVEHHDGINAWISEQGSANLLRPLVLDIYQHHLPTDIDAIFTANTFHIIAWAGVCLLLEKAGATLPAGSLMFVYGPFNYQGQFTSESNARFDSHLKAHNPERGIRDIEAVCEVANKHHLHLIEDNPLPANNRLLVFKRA